MSCALIKLLPLPFLLTVGAAFASDVYCPSHVNHAPLSRVTLYDGPPERMADLMPDVSSSKGGRGRATWDVAYVYQQGRQLHLVCQYTGQPDSPAIRIDEPVRQCVYRAPQGRLPGEMSCR